jgi:hypothetical protein
MCPPPAHRPSDARRRPAEAPAAPQHACAAPGLTLQGRLLMTMKPFLRMVPACWGKVSEAPASALSKVSTSWSDIFGWGLVWLGCRWVKGGNGCGRLTRLVRACRCRRRQHRVLGPSPVRAHTLASPVHTARTHLCSRRNSTHRHVVPSAPRGLAPHRGVAQHAGCTQDNSMSKPHKLHCSVCSCAQRCEPVLWAFPGQQECTTRAVSGGRLDPYPRHALSRAAWSPPRGTCGARFRC